MALKKEEVLAVKGQGFLRNRGTEEFSGRVIPKGGVFSAGELAAVAACAEKFGNGKVAFTARLTAEIVGIPYNKIPEAQAFLQDKGLYFGGTGAKIRPVTACKGTTCVYGCFDTQALALEIHEKYFVGWAQVKLPHKFKIGVGGCPNSCMKPSLNDFGIEGRRPISYNNKDCKSCKLCQVESGCPSKAAYMEDSKMALNSDKCLNCGLCAEKCPFHAVKIDGPAFQIYVGGTWGRSCRNGTPLPRLVGRDEIFPILEKTMLWYKENGLEKERLGMAIDRLGIDEFLKAVMPKSA